LLKSVLGARLSRHSPFEGFLIESGTAPGDVGVVHLVRNTEIVEGSQVALTDARREVTAIDKVFLAEAKEITAVSPFRRGGQPKKKLWTEVPE
jgi:hypothetical protein